MTKDVSGAISSHHFNIIFYSRCFLLPSLPSSGNEEHRFELL